jgi:hypothetical protein
VQASGTHSPNWSPSTSHTPRMLRA